MSGGVEGLELGFGGVLCEGVALLLGSALGFEVAVSEGRPLGSGVLPSSAEQLAPSMRQPVGSPLPFTTKPTVTDSFAASPSLSQEGAVTVTCCPLTFEVAFHSELILAPAGRSNSSVQSSSLAPLSLVTTYWAV